MEKYFSTFDVAKMCHVSPSSVIRWIREGRLQASTTVGGHNRICGDDIVSLLNSLKLPIPDELRGEGELPAEAEPTKILIVDDDPVVIRFFELFFKRHFPEFCVEHAQDGFKAGWIAHGFRPDIILLDLMMPGLDGFGACELIRKFPELASAQIIAMTGYGEAYKDRAMSLGADDFLEKPFEEENLKQKIVDRLAVSKQRGV